MFGILQPFYKSEEPLLFVGHLAAPFCDDAGKMSLLLPHASDSDFRIHSSSTKGDGISGECDGGGATTIFAQSIRNHSPRSRYQIFRSFLESDTLLLGYFLTFARLKVL